MPVRGALAVWPPSIVTLMLVPFTVYVCSAESLLMSWRVSFAVADTHAGVNARPCISTSSVVVGVSQLGAAPLPVLQAAPSPLRAKTASATATHRIRPGSLRDGGRRHHRRLAGVDPDRALLVACLDLTSLAETRTDRRSRRSAREPFIRWSDGPSSTSPPSACGRAGSRPRSGS